jgi:hypothetical protein
MIPAGRPAPLISPDGSLRVDLDISEWRMSHWTNAPRVRETATGLILLDLWGSDWDADVSWPAPGIVRLDLRRYSQPGACAVLLDPTSASFRFADGNGEDGPIGEVKPAIEKVFATANPARGGLPWWKRVLHAICR